MIRRIQIDNFKSLDDFSLPQSGSEPLGQFTCILGVNGSGKTSLLQAFDYLSHLVSGDLHSWVEKRGWDFGELRSRHSGRRGVTYLPSFDLEMDVEGVGVVRWKGDYLYPQPRHTSELIEINGRKVLEASPRKLTIFKDDKEIESDVRPFRFYGSFLYVLDQSLLSGQLLQVKKAIQNLKSLELLTPVQMRRASRPSEQLGYSGESLAGFFASRKPQQRQQILDQVKKFFPKLDRLTAPSKEFGWRELVAHESGISNVNARHLSDGFLRILAIVSQVEQTDGPDSVILLDEIENGLHPELIEQLVRYLLQAKSQIIVTTHSPMILNYLTDEEAQSAMLLLYRNSAGKTRSCRYFDLPTAKKKLGILGPGEVYVDTSVELLTQEAEEMEHASTPGTVSV